MAAIKEQPRTPLIRVENWAIILPIIYLARQLRDLDTDIEIPVCPVAFLWFVSFENHCPLIWSSDWWQGLEKGRRYIPWFLHNMSSQQRMLICGLSSVWLLCPPTPPPPLPSPSLCALGIFQGGVTATHQRPPPELPAKTGPACVPDPEKSWEQKLRMCTTLKKRQPPQNTSCKKHGQHVYQTQKICWENYAPPN